LPPSGHPFNLPYEILFHLFFDVFVHTFVVAPRLRYPLVERAGASHDLLPSCSWHIVLLHISSSKTLRLSAVASCLGTLLGRSFMPYLLGNSAAVPHRYNNNTIRSYQSQFERSFVGETPSQQPATSSSFLRVPPRPDSPTIRQPPRPRVVPAARRFHSGNLPHRLSAVPEQPKQKYTSVIRFIASATSTQSTVFPFFAPQSLSAAHPTLYSLTPGGPRAWTVSSSHATGGLCGVSTTGARGRA
jgi:hypothetical protein